jgi:ankyrin repeat protein
VVRLLVEMVGSQVLAPLDMRQLKLLLEKGAEPGLKDKNNETPLRQHEAVVKLLREKGTEPGAKDEYGQTLLLQVAEDRFEAIAKLLLENCRAQVRRIVG